MYVCRMKNSKLIYPLLFSLSIAHAYGMSGAQKTDSRYDAIGSLGYFDDPDAICSATLIAEDWIMTAEHCRYGGAEDDPFIYRADQVEFKIGEISKRASIRVKLKKWVHGGNIKVNGYEESIDVMFAQLSTRITAVKPIPLLTNPSFTSNPGKTFEIVGYGITTNPLLVDKRQKGQLQVTAASGNAFQRIFQNETNFEKYLTQAHPGEESAVSRHYSRGVVIPGYTVHAWDDRGRKNGKYISQPKGGWISSCNGDSGGPLLQIENGVFHAVGVVSRGYNGDTEACVQLGTIFSVIGPKTLSEIKKNKIPVTF